MNLSQYYKLAKFLREAYEQGGIEGAYQQVISALQAQINTPNQQNLENVGSALDALEAAVEKADFTRMPPTWKPLLEELNLAEYVGDIIHRWARSEITKSGPVLTDAQKALQQEFQYMKDTYVHLDAAVKSLDYFDYPSETLSPGEAEVLIKLPRELFHNEVGEFAARVKLFDQVISTCAEVVGDRGERPKLKEISTTDPVLVALATPATVLFVLKVVNQILDAYKKVVEIREIQKRTKAIGLDSNITKQISREAEKIVEQALSKFIEETKKEKKLTNELAGKLSAMSFKLAAMVDHGARIEGWAIPLEEDPEGEESKIDQKKQQTLEEIQKVGRELRQFEGEGEPILNLPPPNEKDEPK